MKAIVPHSIDYLVRGFDCGWGGPLRVLPMTNILQEAAGEHAIELGFGIPELNERGMTWMLVKADIRVDRLPGWNDRIRVRTWPSGLDRLLALRDIIIETEAGEPLVRSVYAYLIVDLASRRPLRPERAIPELAEIDVKTNGHCVPDFRFGVAELAAADRVPSFRQEACARHRDDNGHVNNAHIIDWLVDAAPESRRGSALTGLRVDFLKEVLVGEALDLAHGKEHDGKPSAALAISGSAGSEASGLVTEARREGECVARAATNWRHDGITTEAD
ncbi:MAG: thioesterase [Treponema sp.]|nr:thioesterase [Treponema sp.]